MILYPDILTILIINGIFFMLASVALFLSVKISLYWDIDATTKRQYQLERESFLISTIIKYIFYIKIALLPFFILSLDKISNLITGAMCSAGVINATDYGVYLLIVKVINIYLFGIWLTIHYLDIRSRELPYTKLKFELFTIAYILLVVEIALIWNIFLSIDIDKIVSCCGTLFSSESSSAIGDIINIDTAQLLYIFYGTSISMYILYKLRIKYLFSIANLIFLVVSIVSLISFFGTYIYELPTHHCPFCFMQRDYYYIGYLIYTLLFLGTFYGIKTGVIEMLREKRDRSYNYSIVYNLLYIIVVTIYPIRYYIENGVWL